MASSVLKLLLLISMILTVKAQVDQANFHLVSTESLEWPWTMARYDEFGDREDKDAEIARRSLHGKGMHYYISYGALPANRIPCPARSGRSYYTHNCYKARGPVNPYTRGCSRITRCRR